MFKEGYKPFNYGMENLDKELLGLWKKIGPKMISESTSSTTTIEKMLDNKFFPERLLNNISDYSTQMCTNIDSIIIRHDFNNTDISIVQETLESVNEPKLVLPFNCNFVAILSTNNKNNIFIDLFDLDMLF